MVNHNSPPAFHIMAKPTGAKCNLDCQYCFFLSKEALYPDSDFRMKLDVQRTYIRQYVQAQKVPQVQIAWQGGEPTLMGLEFFKQSVKLAQQYKKFGMRIEQAIQTNGILLDEEWCTFLHENNFLVGLSIDGPQPLHDAYRIDKGGNPTFQRIFRAARLLQEHQVEFNILCTLHSANADSPLDVYHFFRDELGAKFIQFIPIIERVHSLASKEEVIIAKKIPEKRHLYTQNGNQVSERSITAEQYGNFLITVFDEWVTRDVGNIFIQMFDVALANWMGVAPGLCIHSETCGNALALEHNGDLYSCDHFVEPDFFLGNIKESNLVDLVGSEQQRQFGNDKYATLPKYCLECPVRFACHGGCPKDRFIKTPQDEPGLNYLCAGYQKFFLHIDKAMRFMAAEVRQGRPAANIMRVMKANPLE
jgi:uncharacterized protein